MEAPPNQMQSLPTPVADRAGAFAQRAIQVEQFATRFGAGAQSFSHSALGRQIVARMALPAAHNTFAQRLAERLMPATRAIPSLQLTFAPRGMVRRTAAASAWATPEWPTPALDQSVGNAIETPHQARWSQPMDTVQQPESSPLRSDLALVGWSQAPQTDSGTPPVRRATAPPVTRPAQAARSLDRPVQGAPLEHHAAQQPTLIANTVQATAPVERAVQHADHADVIRLDTPDAAGSLHKAEVPLVAAPFVTPKIDKVPQTAPAELRTLPLATPFVFAPLQRMGLLPVEPNAGLAGSGSHRESTAVHGSVGRRYDAPVLRLNDQRQSLTTVARQSTFAAKTDGAPDSEQPPQPTASRAPGIASAIAPQQAHDLSQVNRASQPVSLAAATDDGAQVVPEANERLSISQDGADASLAQQQAVAHTTESAPLTQQQPVARTTESGRTSPFLLSQLVVQRFGNLAGSGVPLVLRQMQGHTPNPASSIHHPAARGGWQSPGAISRQALHAREAATSSGYQTVVAAPISRVNRATTAFGTPRNEPDGHAVNMFDAALPDAVPVIRSAVVPMIAPPIGAAPHTAAMRSGDVLPTNSGAVRERIGLRSLDRTAFTPLTQPGTFAMRQSAHTDMMGIQADIQHLSEPHNATGLSPDREHDGRQGARLAQSLFGGFAQQADPTVARRLPDRWHLPELTMEAPPVSRPGDHSTAQTGGVERSVAVATPFALAAAPLWAPALPLAQMVAPAVQREAVEPPVQPAPQADATSAAAQAGQQPNIEVLAQKVYEQLRRNLLIDHERRGKIL